MKKLYAILGSALLALPVMAEQPQLPNNGFEDGWKECTPWTSNGNTKPEGTTPGDWTISQVIGINGTGKKTVGVKVAGYNSESAVKVYNDETGFSVFKSIVPGYVTLGTSWSTSVGLGNKDGGTFGGISFTGRPEKITFMYKFEGKNTQPANAIAYLWKGTTTQKSVPGNIVLSGKPTTVDMVDRDRNILGMTTAKGDAVTKSADFELIAKGTTVITELTSDWVKGEIVFEYLSDATPEKINVIFAANDYFTSTGQIQGNALTVDDVKCVYATSPEPVPDGSSYSGKLVVYCEGLGGDLTEPGGKDETIYINPISENTCTFLLPNFSLGEGMYVGDIFLPEVSITFGENDLATFYAKVDGMKLGPDPDPNSKITADVTLNGTVDKEGNASFTIDVMWTDTDPAMPIDVTFNGKGEGGFSGVNDITADDTNAPAIYYNLQGVRVNNPQNGLYIRVQGKNVSKVAIR